MQLGVMITYCEDSQLQVYEPFLASVAIEGLMLTGLSVGCSRTWQNTNKATRVSWGQGSHKIFERSQNAHTKHTKISTIQKFPTIWYVLIKKICA